MTKFQKAHFAIRQSLPVHYNTNGEWLILHWYLHPSWFIAYSIFCVVLWLGICIKQYEEIYLTHFTNE